MKKITEDWLLSADSDLLIIERIIDHPELTHQVAFHAQQAVEKSFKAVIEEYGLGFIRIHSLETLYNLISKKISLSVDIDILILLDQLYIDSRYPGEMGLLPDGKPTHEETAIFANSAKSIYYAIREFLKA